MVEPRPAHGADSRANSRSRARSRKTLRNADYEVRTDTAFEQVMRACAAPRDRPGRHLDQRRHDRRLLRLHQLGYAHSVETWMRRRAGRAGCTASRIGRMFYGESMFSRVSDASKIALAHLARQLERWQFGMIDCQMNTPHLASLGAREIPRSEFLARLQELIHYAPVNHWQFDPDLFT